MTSLQLGLIAAGVALVGAVIVYNRVQERRIRRRIAEAFRGSDDGAAPASAPGSSTPAGRVEPTLPVSRGTIPIGENAARPEMSRDADEPDYEPPLEIHDRIGTDYERGAAASVSGAKLSAPDARGAIAERGSPQPDPDIECIVTLQPARPVDAGAVAAGLHARLGRPVRWFGRRSAGSEWQLLRSDSTGEFSEIAACLLLADRAGAASQPLIDAFVRLIAEIAPALPAAFAAPDAATEAARAEALDRICADLDVQIGLTLLKTGTALVPGTRLRGIAEASGFRLVDGGRFDWVNEETGAVLYTLQNYRSEPFTADTLRGMATPGAVFLLDVPRVADPVRVYDQMKLVAKRMAQTLDAALVDDNRRVLDDAALGAIREQIRATAAALRDVHVEPGSPRALALFGG